MEFSWIPLIRNIKSVEWLYSRSKMVHLWIEILLKVNRVKESYPIGSEYVAVEPGQFISSARRMAAAINCSREIVGEYLKILEHQGWIMREEKGNLTLFTILKKEYLPFLPYTCKNEPEVPSPLSSPEKETSISTSLSTNSTTNPATYIYNINKKNNNIYSLLKREENLKFFEDLRRSEEFWKDAAQLMEVDEKLLKDKGESFFRESILKEDYKDTLPEVKDHLINWLKKSNLSQKNNTVKQFNKNKDNGKNTNDNRRGFDALPAQYDKSSKPKF